MNDPLHRSSRGNEAHSQRAETSTYRLAFDQSLLTSPTTNL